MENEVILRFAALLQNLAQKIKNPKKWGKVVNVTKNSNKSKSATFFDVNVFLSLEKNKKIIVNFLFFEKFFES